MSEIQTELHEYLKEKNLNELFVSIVEAILIDKPGNPIGFMVNHLFEKFPEETKDIRDKLKRGNPPSLVVAKNCGSDELSDTGSDCSSVNTNESVAPDAHDSPSSSAKPPLRKKRRESVCAEKITDDVVEESELKVIEKTQNETARIFQILKSNVFFSHLDEHQMETIHNVMFNVEKSDGDVIISQGDDGDNFYIIDNGLVNVFIESSDTGERKLVKKYEAGDAFGELAIMYNSPRAASCIANGNVRLWALDRVSFNVIMMKTTMAKRKHMTEILLKIPIFSQLTEYELLTIADTLQEETFKDKSVICNQGDGGDKFYLVNEGTAVCTIAQGDGTIVEVARLTSCSYFGEIALLTTKPRQATVTADGELLCLSLNRRTFNRVMGPLQDILMRNIEEYNETLKNILGLV
mmetsp:Transcript_36931/g.79753  ORF Transcript_36931/g.79753 Transcript_36931/m.79753 type:complete len:408 (-) Transcript_36931:238-1461(-)